MASKGVKLLPFQRSILETMASTAPGSDGLLIIARGLGLRAILTGLLRVYARPENMVLLLNATEEEERGLSEELHQNLKVLGFEMPAKERRAVYRNGGIISVTTRIIVVDMLDGTCPREAITGLVVLHADRVTPESNEAFAIRLYREENKTGFLKAFTDQPEQFTYGLAPLQTVMTQLRLRNVYVWPRFHADVQSNLAKRKADVVELHQDMTESMDDIQTSILQCLELTIAEVKRSNTGMDADDINIDNALFRTLSDRLEASLQVNYSKSGPRTRSLVADISTLRKLLSYLVSLDCVAFNQFLETIISANTTNAATGAARQHQSPWLLLPAADTIFNVARRRVYLRETEVPAEEKEETVKVEESPDEPTVEELEMAFAAMDEAEGLEPGQTRLWAPQQFAPRVDKGKGKASAFAPEGSKAVLEEQPKWHLLAQVLSEIETDMWWANAAPDSVSNDTILVMCEDAHGCATLRSYLSSLDDVGGEVEHAGRPLLEQRLDSYFVWKAALGKLARQTRGGRGRGRGGTSRGGRGGGRSNGRDEDDGVENAALRRKREYKKGDRGGYNKRRRVRGGGSVQVGAAEPASANEALELEVEALAASGSGGPGVVPIMPADTMPMLFDGDVYDEYFGLCDTSDLVVIRPYGGDEDDRILEELRPKYIVMYDPDPAFVRRVEVYRSLHASLAVRVYFLLYSNSVEEQRYLAGIRREKDAFERLIRERSIMAIPLDVERRPGDNATIRVTTNSARAAGGSEAIKEPSKVIIDLREFRSQLPSMLHAAGVELIPRTLTIGDYVLSPDLCVERKSLPDLIQSFNSGRLYQQCEVMSIHYPTPILLIEFDAKKAFSLAPYIDGKAQSDTDLPSKLVLLTLSFPRLRVIWSSSPQATAAIFLDLKAKLKEPDVDKAAIIGLDEADALEDRSGTGEAAPNQGPQDFLRTLPGISSKNYRYVANRVESVEALCALDKDGVRNLIGAELGAELHTFLAHDTRSNVVE